MAYKEYPYGGILTCPKLKYFVKLSSLNNYYRLIIKACNYKPSSLFFFKVDYTAESSKWWLRKPREQVALIKYQLEL